GMTFAGGPLNNYVLQATVKMAELLQADGPALGLVSSVSGMLTKQAFAVWSSHLPDHGFIAADTSALTAQRTSTRPVTANYDGPATVASYTVVGAAEGPDRAVVIADLPDGSRTIATTDAVSLAQGMTGAEWCARPIDIRATTFRPAD
ncbi:MAG TPA: hypothetical protein VLL25_08345, partial [Acidimicrobiales bacterium]|nr:hypothetical protein [Acidimicrobiales bacterium]